MNKPGPLTMVSNVIYCHLSPVRSGHCNLTTTALKHSIQKCKGIPIVFRWTPALVVLIRWRDPEQNVRGHLTYTPEHSQGYYCCFAIRSCLMHWVFLVCHAVILLYTYPVSILHKSIVGRYRPVRVADGPMTASYRFM